MRAELTEWWGGGVFPEQQLLKDLYGRAARRSERRGSRDSRRRPDHKEGLRVAKAMLADIPDVGRLDRERESAAVSAVLAAPPPSGVFSPGMLPEYISSKRLTKHTSATSPVSAIVGMMTTTSPQSAATVRPRCPQSER